MKSALGMKALFILLVLCGIAVAQETGGHMGGGDWGSHSSSSPSYSSSHSSSSWSSSGGWSSSHSSSSSKSSSWSSTKPSTSHNFDTPAWDHTPGEYKYPESHFQLPTETFFFIGVVITALIVIFFLYQAFARTSEPSYVSLSDGLYSFNTGDCDVTVLRVALDGRARKFVQRELKVIADQYDTSTAVGRAGMLSEVANLLRRTRDAWVYGGAVNEPMRTVSQTKPAYDRFVDDARSRFQHETISNVQGQRRIAAGPDITPHSFEGEGLILVTLIIAARTQLYTVSFIRDGEDLRKALEAVSYLSAEQLVAVDIVWTPSEENDRMSSMELEARYPRPEVIPITGALVGKTFCVYCSGPFPAELVSCPHCGAPARKEAA